MRIDGFEWDEGNIEKNLLKHNVTPEEAEEAFSNNPRKILKSRELLLPLRSNRRWSATLRGFHNEGPYSKGNQRERYGQERAKHLRAMKELTTMTKKKIPEFKTEDEAFEFWDTHSGADYIDEMEDVTESVVVTPPKRKTTVRLDDAAIERIKALAERKGMPWQTLMRMWVYERLEEEERRAG